MYQNRSVKLFLVIAAVMLSISCGMPAFMQGTPTPTPEPTNTPKPTKTPVPTRTPRPTATPDVAATQQMENIQSDLQMFYDEEKIPNMDGELFFLEDFYKELAMMNYLDFGWAGYEDTVKNFVIWGDVAWESAIPVRAPEISGCGYAFRVTEDGDWYTALLTNDLVYMGYCDATFSRCGYLGTTRGSGRLNFGTGAAKASMTMVVIDSYAYVYVDNELIGEYSLFTDKLLEPGAVFYGMLSGTNKDYGTRCEVSNTRMWVIE
ncbi:MAG: hypothetical protein JXA13_13540 [Anaerolineales bacterium]|nr:hypothetical protein [Anaerolineales bacterium]